MTADAPVLCRISQIFIRPGAQRSHQKRDPAHVECCICMEHTSRQHVSGNAGRNPEARNDYQSPQPLGRGTFAHITLEPTSDDTAHPPKSAGGSIKSRCPSSRRQIEAALHVEVPPQKRFPAATPATIAAAGQLSKPAGYGNSVYSCHPYRRRPLPHF